MECILGQGDLLRLDGKPEGVVLHCLRGTVWITKGDGVDYLVHAGSSFELRPGSTAVVEALGSAEVRLKGKACRSAGAGPVLSQLACRPM